MKSLKVRLRNKEIIKENKTKCFICGETDSCCLEYHHLKDKSFNISRDSKFLSTAELLLEINKCVVLCSNCHKKLHNNKIKLVLNDEGDCIVI